MTEPAVLPCLGHQDLYDALFNDATRALSLWTPSPALLQKVQAAR
ncbi:hypothetical protein [Streptomyces sp. NPDC047968]